MKRLTQKIYEELAASRGLKLLTEVLPDTGLVPVEWQCLRCGKLHSKSYRAVKNRPNGCRCQKATTYGREEYEALASSLGITYLPGEYAPPNTETPQHWSVNGKVLTASYHELAHKMPNRIKQALGMPYRPRQEKASV